MKHRINTLLIAFSLFAVSINASQAGLFRDSTYPGHATGAVTQNVKNMRTGESSYISILGIFTIGDGGVSRAAKNGNINKVSFVDHKTKSFIVFRKNKTVVYGN